MTNKVLSSNVYFQEDIFESYSIMDDGSYYLIRLDTGRINPTITILNEMNQINMVSKACVELDRRDVENIIKYLNEWLDDNGV